MVGLGLLFPSLERSVGAGQPRAPEAEIQARRQRRVLQGPREKPRLAAAAQDLEAAANPHVLGPAIAAGGGYHRCDRWSIQQAPNRSICEPQRANRAPHRPSADANQPQYDLATSGGSQDRRLIWVERRGTHFLRSDSRICW